MKGEEILGPHLILDGYGCDPVLLADMEHIYNFLDNTPDIIGMTKIMPPYVFKFQPLPPHPPEDSGISGFVIIAESHISIHTYPERAYLSLDVFSCRPFPVPHLLELTRAHFRISHYVHRVLDRGIDFPARLDQAKLLCLQQRRSLPSLTN